MRARALMPIAIVACWTACSTPPPAAEALSATWVEAEARPALTGWTLSDHHDAPFTEARLSDTVSVVAVGYTSCPDVCPTTLQALGPAVAQLRAEGHTVQGVFLAVDPERDRPRLPDWISFFSEDGLVGVTGEVDAIDHAVEQLGAAYSLHVEDGRVVVDHSSSLFVVGADARVRGYVLRPSRAERIVADLRPLLEDAP